MPIEILGLAILMTVTITVASFVIGAVLAVPLLFMRISRFVISRFLARAIIDIIRGVPPVVWIFILYFGLSSELIRLESLAAAIAALSVISAAYLAEIYRGGLLAVHKGQTEASRALGMNAFGTFSRILAPQAVRVCLPSASTYAISLLKDSSLASTIGVADILFRATAVARIGTDAITPFVFAGLLYIALSLPLAILSRRLDGKLRTRVSI